MKIPRYFRQSVESPSKGQQKEMQCLVIDFGSQFTKLIARRVRQLQVTSTIVPYTKAIQTIQQENPKALILSGAPTSVAQDFDSVHPFIHEILAAKRPTLCICYAMQAVCAIHGGQISSETHREYGDSQIDILDHQSIFSGLPSHIRVWMSHADTVTTLPEDFQKLAVSKNGECVAACHKERPLYCTQFHPEVSHTEYGLDILKHFLFSVACCSPDWDTQLILERILKNAHQCAEGGNIIAGVSGGVDSTVAASIIHRVHPKKLVCVFVETGLLRKNETQTVQKYFSQLGILLRVIDAKAIFLRRLEGVTDPEKKRKIIGKTFIDVFEKEAQSIPNIRYLLQGTLYPDVIESQSDGLNSMIKSHHNVGGLPEKMQLSLIEPLRELFKDEVREIGALLGVPPAILHRHPFPGPGLAVRIMGNITEEKIATLQNIDDLFIRALIQEKLYNEIWQAFAVLLDTKTVGVMGDGRSYENICALRAVTSEDGMTADSYNFKISFLKRVANTIVNTVPGVSRVLYDLTSKPPGTIEWE